MSTESGISDFRSPGGIWSKYKPVTIQEFKAKHENRLKYWQYKKETFEQFHNAAPNSGHNAIVHLEKMGRLRLLITQNIDGLHQEAGNSPEKVLELHGNERVVKCLNCGKAYERVVIQKRLLEGEDVPVCGKCGGWLKPATISFGQELPKKVLERAYRESEKCDVFLVVGSSLTVQPASLLPVTAKTQGAWLGILNRDPTHLDYSADWVCHESAGKVLTSAIGSSRG